MNYTHVIGIDPGIVHTGVVSLLFDRECREVVIDHEVILGPDGSACRAYIDRLYPGKKKTVFVEHYRVRGVGSSHDKDMLIAVSEIAKATKGKALDNTGVKKIVKPGILMALGAWVFSTPTHHDDLRSAARIAVLGMMKDPDMNRLLADVIRDHLAGKPWTITN